MRKKVIAFLLLTGVLFIGAAFQSEVIAFFDKIQKKSPEEMLQLAREKDKNLLLEQLNNSDPKRLEAALHRLGSVQDSLARQRAVELARHSDPKIRAAAASGLGYYLELEAQDSLNSLLKDSDAKVRVSALRALGYRQSEQRHQILDERVASFNASDSESLKEWIVAVEAKKRLSNPKQKNELKGVVSQKLRNWITKTQDKSQIGFALDKLTQLDMDRESLKEFVRPYLARTDDRVAFLAAFRYLVFVRDPHIKNSYRAYLSVSDPLIKKVVLQSIAKACPANRWTLFHDFITTEKNRELVKEALGMVASWPDQEALSLLKRLETSTKLELPETRAIQNKYIPQLEQLMEKNIPVPCAHEKSDV